MRRGWVLLPLPLLLLAGCFTDMYDQPKYEAYEKSAFLPDGTEAQPLPDGAVDRSALFRDGAASIPPPVNTALLDRGRERFNAFCVPCHGAVGDGDGIVVQRGFPPPPSYHTLRLLRAPAGHYFDVITDGYGVMYSYADRVPPRDRWAIIAYIRALQLARMDPAERQAALQPADTGR
ncbi:MAG: cytochrome c [Geminicoccaceae bacterium]|nr:cytochrome c [Geminicoccaceae bacterium]